MCGYSQRNSALTPKLLGNLILHSVTLSPRRVSNISSVFRRHTRRLHKQYSIIKYYQYRIKSGDTLYALANHYGVSIQSILNYNTGLKPETLKIGKTILIPALKSVGTYSGKNIVQAGNFDGTHTIRQGDTLWSLALKYSVSVELLAQKNNLSVNSVLKLGNTLKVPIL